MKVFELEYFYFCGAAWETKAVTIIAESKIQLIKTFLDETRWQCEAGGVKGIWDKCKNNIKENCLKESNYVCLILEHSETCEAILFYEVMEEVHYLGKLCKNNHGYKNSDKTLRFISDRSCVECRKLKQSERNQKRKEDLNEKIYLGDLCVNNHNFEKTDKSLRYVSTNFCVECKKISDSKSYYNRQESILGQKKDYYKENKESLNLKSKEYYRLNKDKFIENIREYYQKNKEWLNKKDWERKKERISNNPILKLNRRMSSAINKTLKSRNTTKGDKSYLDLVDFTIEELAIHLEKHFTEGMNWDNYGNCEECWHVDHIKPKISFDYKSPHDLSFKECWSLNNFQPLWKSDNLSKGAKSMEEWVEYKNNKKETND